MVSAPSRVRPAPLACIECRAKHLKCDGVTPRCGRCMTEVLRCVYKPSRRGYGRRKANDKSEDPEATVETLSGPTPLTASPASNRNVQTGSLTSEPTTLTDHSRQSEAARAGLYFAPPLADIQPADTQLLIKAYYACFHPSHPLLVPQQAYAKQRYPEYLERTICCVAQHYVGNYSASFDISGAVKIMLGPDKDDASVSRVQALVIYAIMLHSTHRPHEALDCVQRAGVIAKSISLNRLHSTSWNVTPGTVEEESIRRTWWELYVTEAYLAALHQQPSLLSISDETSFPILPSTEESYDAGICDTHPVSVTTFENRAFANNPVEDSYPTACYRIEAIRIIRRVLRLWASGNTQSNDIQTIDNAIASWRYYLPGSRTDVVDDFGKIDPVFFQAHFFVHSASILLHFPRSDLPSKVPSAAEIACLDPHTQRIPSWSPHSVKAVNASKEISKLAASLSSTESCPPLFTCALILASIVQLAVSTVHRGVRGGACIPQHRDHIILLLGVLTRLGQRWAVARNALLPLRLIADTIFGTPLVQDGPPRSDISFQGPNASAKDALVGSSWFDLFSVDDLMANFMATEPGPSYRDPHEV